MLQASTDDLSTWSFLSVAVESSSAGIIVHDAGVWRARGAAEVRSGGGEADMGYSLTWTAVRGKPAEAVLGALGLARTERTNEDGVTRGDPFAWCQLDGGWVLVLADAGTADARFLDERRGEDFLASLSAGCEIVACFVEEHVMVSRAAAWRNGVRLWDVKHDAQVALDHLEKRVSELPAGAENAEAEARANLANDPDPCDYLFDVPVAFAHAVVPYRYDMGDHVYEELDRVADEAPRRAAPGAGPAPARRSFLSRLFGR
jgi:hypothetical protein